MSTTVATPVATTPVQHEGRRSRLGRRWSESMAYQLFLIPIGIVFVVLFLIPLAQTLYYSLTNASGYSNNMNFVGLANYQRILTDNTMLAGLTFTVLYTVATTILITLLAIPLAVVLNRKFFARNLVRSVFFFPAVPSLAILGLVWGYILSPLASGALNSLLEGLFSVGPFPWLSDDTLARASVIGVALWSSAGWHAVIYLAYLQSIPADIYESATVDGATPRQQFFHITLPLLTPAIAISQFLLLTSGLRVYDLPFTLTKGGPGFATNTITQSIITNGVAQGRYGLASALSVLFTLSVAVVVVAQLLVSRRLERRVS
jgi:multiple sugar transport system permease protein/raffinose/stachyose/melibiose transport system permease protein